eukprot:2620822-Rhodomonas_salina.1
MFQAGDNQQDPCRGPVDLHGSRHLGRFSVQPWVSCVQTTAKPHACWFGSRDDLARHVAAADTQCCHAQVAGGHTIDSVEPIYGLIAIGVVHPVRPSALRIAPSQHPRQIVSQSLALRVPDRADSDGGVCVWGAETPEEKLRRGGGGRAGPGQAAGRRGHGRCQTPSFSHLLRGFVLGGQQRLLLKTWRIFRNARHYLGRAGRVLEG